MMEKQLLTFQYPNRTQEHFSQKMNDKSVIKLLYSGLEGAISDHTSFRLKEGGNLEKDILKSVDKISKSIDEIDKSNLSILSIYFPM